ncbi:MAG: ABATE domain-containing protein [Solirubrobacterales bacterium]|nr:ABATE domain-containing protein [Solirubrobacterales bacterium]
MSDSGYDGPLRGERPAIELVNTRFADRGGVLVDGLADPGAVPPFLRAVLPDHDGPPPHLGALLALRGTVTSVLRASLAGTPLDSTAIAALNRTASRCPTSPLVVLTADGVPTAHVEHHGPRADVPLVRFAADAIDLLTGPARATLRACVAPGCVLLFLKDHPRRTWCSPACGNRARQARHYTRHRRAQPDRVPSTAQAASPGATRTSAGDEASIPEYRANVRAYDGV